MEYLATLTFGKGCYGKGCYDFQCAIDGIYIFLFHYQRVFVEWVEE